MSFKPTIVLFQCQYCLAASDDQHWVENDLPGNVKLIKTPCSGRISPLFVLNAFQSGADGVLISGCMPEKCHYKKGNLGARRQLDEFMRLLEYLGMDAGRVHFVWMGVDERGRIQRELGAFEQTLTGMGHSTKFAAQPEKANAGGSHE